MSRCFPYPPPGYAMSIAKKEALIESIKFQREKVKAEELRKEKKREKKEKRKHKKEKITLNHDNSDIAHGEKFFSDSKADLLHKESKSQQLERSDLTEEHAEPVRFPSSSSESSENSHKRKRLSSPVDVSRSHGKIIRIRLPSKNASSDEQKNCCSTSGRANLPPQTNNGYCPMSGSRKMTHLPPQIDNGFCSTSGSTGNVSRSLVLKSGGERIQVASKPIEPARVLTEMQKEGIQVASKPIEPARVLTKMQKEVIQVASKPIKPARVLTRMQKEGLLYENLIGNWAPPQLQDGSVDGGDMDWLFASKSEVKGLEKRSVCRDDKCNTMSLWPCAQYLPEVDVYALPFTVPF